MVGKVSFSIAAKVFGRVSQFQHGCKGLWWKRSNSAFIERVVVKLPNKEKNKKILEKSKSNLVKNDIVWLFDKKIQSFPFTLILPSFKNTFFQNETKPFEFTLDRAGILTCVIVDYGDGHKEYFGSLESCRVKFPLLTSADVLEASIWNGWLPGSGRWVQIFMLGCHGFPSITTK